MMCSYSARAEAWRSSRFVHSAICASVLRSGVRVLPARLPSWSSFSAHRLDVTPGHSGVQYRLERMWDPDAVTSTPAARRECTGFDRRDRFEDEPARLCDGDVARGQVLAGSIGDRSHAHLNDRVFVDDAASEAGEVAVLHELAV